MTPIERYLAALRLELRTGRRRARRVVHEVADHLREAAEAEEASGLAREEAEQRAIARFGSPGTVAARFNASDGHGHWLLPLRGKLRLVVPLVATGAGGLAFLAYALVSSPSYEARVQLLVGPVTGNIQTIRAAGGLAPTYAVIATSMPVLEGTAKTLRLPISSISGDVTARANRATRIVTIRVRASDPDTAVAIAHGVAEELVSLSSRQGRPEMSLRLVGTSVLGSG